MRIAKLCWNCLAIGVLGTATSDLHANALAAYNVGSGTLMNPGTGSGTADAWYCAQPTGCTASGTRQLWSTNYPVELTALANALHNNVDLIYEFVRNNVEIVPIYGLQKGALGALIDRSGTAFDQVQLMVELLRLSGYTVNYQAGTITLDGTQVNSWLGTNDSTALQQIFADGGIPATVTPSTGTATSVTLSHVWVQVNIGGTNYLFDPAYKPHVFTTGVDIAAASGWNDASFLGAAQSGMLSGTQTAPNDSNTGNVSIPYVSNVNGTGASNQLTTYANNLVTYLRNNGPATKKYAQMQLDDVVGRQDIQPQAGPFPVRQTSLPYNAVAVQHTWPGGGNVPDVYRTKLVIELLDRGTPALSQTLFADEVYGRRMLYDTFVSGTAGWNDGSVQLLVDGIYVGPRYSLSSEPDLRYGSVRLSIDHPYAASNGTYMDQNGATAIVKNARFISPIVIVTGFGDVSERLQQKFTGEQVNDKLLPPSTFFNCSPAGCEPLDKPQQPAGETGLARAYAGWLAQYSRMALIQMRIRGGNHEHHHTLGIAYRHSYVNVTDPHASPSTACSACWAVGSGATVLDLDSAVSLESRTANATDRTALAHSMAVAADTLEASQFEQIAQSSTPASVASRFAWGTSNNVSMKYYLMSPAARSSSLFPNGPLPTPYLSIYWNAMSDYLNAGWKVLVAQNQFLGPGKDCNPTPCTDPTNTPMYFFERGGAYQALSPDGVTTANITTDTVTNAFKGGSAGSAPIYDEAYSPDKVQDLLKDQFKDRSRDFGVDLASGEFTYSTNEEVSVGLGDFPYKLSFARSFRTGESHSPGLGKGWSHNLDIRVDMSSNGMEAMGETSALASAGTLIALYATQQIYAATPGTDASLLARWVTVPFIQDWWAGKIIRFNVVTYTAGSSSKTFVRLPDGTFSPAGGYNPADGSSYWNLVQTGQPTGYGVGQWNMSGVTFTLTSPAQDVQTFAYWNRVNRDLAQPYLYGHHHGWHITTWSFPQGMSLTFNYVPIDNTNFAADMLQSISNSLGKLLNLNFTVNSLWDDCNFNSVNDGQGHVLTFNCATASATSPAGDVSRVVYGTSNCNIGTWPDRTVRPRCSPYITDVFGPSSTTSAKVHIVYDAADHVATLSDAVAVTTPANRNPYNFFISGGTRGERQDPAGNVYAVYYDAFGRAIQFIDELGNATNVTYDGFNHVLSRTSPEGIKTDFAYDPRGNTTQIKTTPNVPSTPATLSVNATYDTACGKIKTAQDANGNTTTWFYNSTTCLVDHVQQPTVLNGVTGSSVQPTTQYTYAAAGLVQTITDPSGVQVKYTYDASGNRTLTQVDPNGINQQTHFAPDAVGNIQAVQTGRGNTTTYTYDADRRVTKITGPAGTCGATGSTISENVWAGGVVQKVRHAKICTTPNESTDTDWQVWSKQYTPTDKIFIEADPDGGTLETDYDPLDRVEYVRQSASPDPTRVTRNVYDAAGQLLFVYRGWGTADQIQYAGYMYSPDGRLISTKDANLNLTQYTYDGYGRKFKTIFADNSFEQYAPDNNGNVLRRRNRDGMSIAYVFDGLNRETSRTVPANPAFGGAGDTQHSYTETYDLASRKYDTAVDGQTLNHRYDTGGRLILVKDTLLNALGASIGNVGYSYDASGNRQTVSVTAAQGPWTTSYDYDSGERPFHVTSGTTTFAQYGYDPLSRVQNVSFLDATGVAYAYEADDDIQSISHTFTGGSLTLSYTHNGAHQIKTMMASNSDFLNTDVVPAVTYTPNNLNEYTQVGAATITNDINANLTGDGTWTYRYDEENQLREVVGGGTTIDYKYDADGRRRSKSVNGTTTYYVSDGGNEFAELNSSGTRTRLYVNGTAPDTRLATYDDAGGTGWATYHTNHQGSVLFTTQYSSTGTSGTVGATYRYDAFGVPAQLDAATGNPIRYTGRYLDGETGLYYYRARYYSAKLGRFLQTDPIGDKDDLNLYAYAGNNPLNRTDPSGMYTCSGSKDNCDAVEAGLGRARQALDKMKPGATHDKLANVLGLFGKAGDKNGLNVSFSAKTDVASAKMEKDGTISVSINSNYAHFGTGYDSPQDVRASSLVHEGQHGVDEKTLGRNPQNRDEVKATERNAYDLESRFQQTMGTKSFHGLWDPSWRADEAESKRASAVEKYAEYSTQAWCANGGTCP